MKTNLLITTLLIALVFACSKPEDEFPVVEQPNPVRLSALEDGQQSLYIRYSLDCIDVENSFEWTNDTLILEVVKDGDQLQLKESLTPRSPMLLNGNFTQAIFYPVNKIPNGLLFPDRSASALFFFYANDTLRLDPAHDVNLVQENCSLTLDGNPFIGNDIGKVNHLKFGPIQYTDMTAVSCEPFFNLDAYLLYDKNALNLSHVLTFDSMSVVYGWQLLEN